MNEFCRRETPSIGTGVLEDLNVLHLFLQNPNDHEPERLKRKDSLYPSTARGKDHRPWIKWNMSLNLQTGTGGSSSTSWLTDDESQEVQKLRRGERTGDRVSKRSAESSYCTSTSTDVDVWGRSSKVKEHSLLTRGLVVQTPGPRVTNQGHDLIGL